MFRDKFENPPDHPDYDPSSVYISESEFKALSPMMKQYWSIKRDNFDSIVLFRFGKWYFLYFHDLKALNEVSDTPINFSYQYHGFVETQRDKYIEALVMKGYRVILFEQTETTEMMQKRIKEISEKINKKEISVKKMPVQIVNREIYAIYTRATYLSAEEEKELLGKTEVENSSLESKFIL